LIKGVQLMKQSDLEKKCHSAHQYASNNRKEILASELCGCFYCRETFPPSEISEWQDAEESGIGQTALCPHCGIDSVIGSNHGVPVTKLFLSHMHKVWFNSNPEKEYNE